MNRCAVLVLVPMLVAGCGEETTPPEVSAPTITSPRSGSTLGRLKVTVRGTAEPDRAVEVFIDSPSNPVQVFSSGTGTFEARDLALGGQGGRVIWARMAQDTALVSPPVVLTMDYTANTSPVILFPTHGMRIPAGSVPVAGRAPAGVSSVEIYRNGALMTTAPVEGGAFTTALDPSGAGQVSLWTRGFNSTGGHTALSESIAVIVGGGQTQILQSIDTPSADALLSALAVAVEGRATGSASLALLVDGGDTGARFLPLSGEFSFAPVQLLDEGPHVLGVASVRDGSLVAEGGLRVWIDRTAPAPPAIIRPAAGEVHLVSSVLVEGASEAGATVDLAVDGEWLPPLVAGADGVFSSTLVLPGDGQYSLTARAHDPAGNSSSVSPERMILIDSAAPFSPTLYTPGEGSLITTGVLTVTGTAQSGSWLGILVDGNVADEGLVAGGGFEITLPTPLPDGAHGIRVRAASAPGAGWVRGDSVSFSVDLDAPAAPLILQPPDSSTLSASTLVVAGAAERRATVRLVVDGEPEGQTVANSSGAWSLTLAAPGTDGAITLQATAVDTAGHVGPAGALHTVFLDRTAPALTITTPEVDQLFTANPVVVGGTTEPGATVLVDGRTVAVTGGSFQASVFLSEGPDTVVVTASDAPGNAVTVRLPLTLDTTPPFITLSSPVESLLTQGSSVTVAGTTEIGSTVTVQGSPVSVDAAGSFSGVVSLPWGWTTITVDATDRAGWTSREQRHVVRDALPTAPSSLSPDGGAFVTTGRPTLALAAATDANGDALLHTMEIYADATLTQRVAQSPPLPAVGGRVSWVVTPELGLTGGYRYWRARAFDGVLHGPWSSVATFRVPDIGARDPHRILGYGDSITAGAQTQNGGWIYCEGYREELELALTAFFGSATVDTTWVPGGASADGVNQMDERLAGRVDSYLLILFGTIDAGVEPPLNLQTVKNNIAAIAAYARSIGMVAVVGTVPPRLDEAANLRIQQLNALLLQLEDGNGIVVADHYARLVDVAAGDLRRVVCEDGVHPSDLGYSVIAEVWYRALTGTDDYPAVARAHREKRVAVASLPPAK